nr:hypothetical protein [Tanacetum cinerariifolium]
MTGLLLRMFRVDRIEDRGTMREVQNGVALDEEQLLFIAGGQDNAVDEDVDEQLVQDLALNVDNVFQADECDAFDSDVDEAPAAQTMFMETLSSAYLVYDEAGPSYDSDILFEALTKEIKEIKAIFDELEAKVDQNVVNRKCDKIERNNLLILNDTLIANFLSKEVFYIATKSELNVSRFSKIHDAHTVVQARCLELKTELSKLKDKIQKADHDVMVKRFSNLEDGSDFDSVFEIKKLKVSIQGKENVIRKLRTVENAKVKQHYKELYDSIKITYTKHIDQTIAFLTENANLKVQINAKLKCITIDSVIPKFLAPGMYAIDSEPIPPRLRNNREVHLDYLKHLKESVETLREIVDEDKIERPLDRSHAYACIYTKHSQELLEYVISTCSKDFNKRDKKQATTPLTRKKQVTFVDQCETSNNNTHKHVEQQTTQKTYVLMIPSTGVNNCIDASGSNPRRNTNKNKISSATSVNRKTVEDHPRTNKSNLQKTNHVDSSTSSKRTVINLNSDSVCQTCNKCFISANHDMCVIKYLNSVNASSPIKNIMRKVKQVWKPKPVKQVWKATSKVHTNVGYQWKPIGRIFTLGEQCPLTRFTQTKVVPAKQPENVSISKIVVTENLSCSKHMTGDRSRLRNFVKKFIGTFRFGNDHFGAIIGYRDYVIGDSVIFRVYYVEGLGHNLFSVGQFCDSDLEVAFRKHSCYVRESDGVKLTKGSRGSNLYTILVEDIMKSSSIYLLSKASKIKSWLWHRRLNHLIFGTINDLVRKDLVRGLPRLKFEKDHLCSACQIGKSKKHTHSPKTENTNLEVLNTLHMDLCGPIRVKTINRKKYILVIVDDYMRFTWVKFLRSKDETPAVVIKFLKQIQEVVATACYSQNWSLIHTRYNKTPYELVHDKKPDFTFLLPVLINSAGTPSSTSIDQDAPSPSHSPSSLALQSLCLHLGVKDEPTLMDENLFALVDNDPFINIFAPEPI